MSEVGLMGGAKMETCVFARDLELGALEASPVAKPAEALQRVPGDVAASDPPGAFALIYASGSQGHGRTPAAPCASIMRSARDDDSPEGRAAGDRERCGTSPAPHAPGPAAAGAHGATSDFAAYALAPQTPSNDSRSERRQRERRRPAEPEQREEIESQKPGYTIDDIVQFGGVTVAERHTQLTDLADRAS